MTRAIDFVKAAKEDGCFCFDVEHPPELSAYLPDFRLAGCGFATKGVHFYETDLPTIRWIIRALFSDDKVEAVAYNCKYDLKCLTAVGITDGYHYPKKLRDPMIAVNLLDESRQHSALGLKAVIYDQYGYQMRPFEEAWAFGEKSKEFMEYAEDDCQWEYRLYKDIKPKLIDEGLFKLFTDILMKMTKVAADMELAGVGWDIQGGGELLRGFQKFRANVEKEIYAAIGQLNLASGDQLANRLFKELGYSTKNINMTPSGKRFATDSQAMEHLAKKYPICKKIVQFRTATKMINTYVEPLTRLALDDPYGRIHPTLWLVSQTGRTRMEKPNFQNIPAWLDALFAHLNIREKVIAPRGYKMIVSDLSQIELRICGHVTQDPVFLEAYRTWVCRACDSSEQANIILHKCPNCGCAENEDIFKDPTIKGFYHGLDLHQMTTDAVPALGGDRNYGKTCNFALIYYATAYRMHYEFPEFSVAQWDEVIAEFFQKYQGVRKWHIRTEHLMYNGGVITDIFSRKRRITKDDIRRNPKHALNQAINFPVQSAACEYIQLVMINLRQQWIDEGVWQREVYFSNMIHDEIVAECPEHLVERYKKDIQYHMENTVRFSVPIRTDIKVCDNWSQGK